uniref:Hes B n=1 Tax=Crepidula fornicata TaxID=176853 RepID=A0A1U8Y0M4_CREFO|nr:Hes B [Crepidula fornicata]
MAETMIASSVKSEHSTRKNKKPLMEKRRRARINSCLSQLKSLVLQAIKKDSSQFSKLEKADILELTVKHLRALQRQQAAGAMSQDTTVVSKYRAGFNECAKEVVRYMGSVREVNTDVKERVVGHLANCLQVVNQITPMESLQHQQPMKPLHVQIPQQAMNTASVAPSVIMHTAAAASSQLGYVPVSRSSVSAHQEVSISATPLSALPLQSAAAMTTAPTTVSPAPTRISGAFKIVPSSSGAVALYLGGANSVNVPRSEAVSVDAVPLYSVSLPQNDNATAFVTPPPTSHVTSSHIESQRYQAVSPVKGDYTPIAPASLPVDLRQTHKMSFDSSVYSPLSVGQCSPASLSDEKLWRPW